MKNLVELTAITDDPRFGDLVVMYDPNDPLNRVMKKTKQSETEEEHSQTIEQARFRQEINHPNILRLLEIDDDQANLVASVFFEFPDSTLDLTALSSDEIILMFRDILRAIVYLQSNKMIHGDIRSDYICFSRSENCYKLLDRLGDFSSPIQCQLNNINNYRALYTSPIIFNELMKQSKKIKQNSYKSECFALGMNVLGFYTDPETVQEIYDFDSGAFNEALFEQIARTASAKPLDSLSQAFVAFLLKNVLVLEEKDRMNPQGALEELLRVPELQGLFSGISHANDLEGLKWDPSPSPQQKTVYYNPFEFIDKTSVQARNMIKAEIFGDVSNQNVPENHLEQSNFNQVPQGTRRESEVDINKFIMSHPQSISNIKNAIVNNNVRSARISETPQPIPNIANDLISLKVPDKDPVVVVQVTQPEVPPPPKEVSPSFPVARNVENEIIDTEKRTTHPQMPIKQPTPQNSRDTRNYESSREPGFQPNSFNSPTRVDHLQDMVSLDNLNFAHYGQQYITSPGQPYQNFGYNSQPNIPPYDYQQYGSFPHLYGQQYGGGVVTFNQPAESQQESDDDMGQYLQSLGINVDQELAEERLEEKIRHVHGNIGISADELVYREMDAISKVADVRDADRKQRVKLSEYLKQTTKSDRDTVTSEANKYQGEFRDPAFLQAEHGQYVDQSQDHYLYKEKRLSISNHTYLPMNEFDAELLENRKAPAKIASSSKRWTDGNIQISNNFVFSNKHQLKQADSLPDYLDDFAPPDEAKPLKSKTLISTQPQNYFLHNKSKPIPLSPAKQPEPLQLPIKEEPPKIPSQIQQGPLTHQYVDSTHKKEPVIQNKATAGNKSNVIGNLKKFAEECKIDFDTLESKGAKVRSKSPMLAPCKKEITRIAKITSSDDQNVFLNSGPNRPLPNDPARKEKSVDRLNKEISIKDDESNQPVPKPENNSNSRASPSHDGKIEQQEKHALPQTKILQTTEPSFFEKSHLPPIFIPLIAKNKGFSQEDLSRFHSNNELFQKTVVNLANAENFFSTPTAAVEAQPLNNTPEKIRQVMIPSDQRGGRSLTPNQISARQISSKYNNNAKVEVVVSNEQMVNFQIPTESPLIGRNEMQQGAPNEQASPSKVLATKTSHRNLTIQTSDERLVGTVNHVVIKQNPNPLLIKAPHNSDENIGRTIPDQGILYQQVVYSDPQVVFNPNQVTYVQNIVNGQAKPKQVFEIRPDEVVMPRSHKGSYRTENRQHFHSNVTTPRKDETPAFLYANQTQPSNKDPKPLFLPQQPVLYSGHPNLIDRTTNALQQQRGGHQSVEKRTTFSNSREPSKPIFQNSGPQITSFQAPPRLENEYYFYEELPLQASPLPPQQPQINIYQNYIPAQSQRVVLQNPPWPIAMGEKVVRVSNGAQDRIFVDRSHPATTHQSQVIHQGPMLYQPTYAPKAPSRNLPTPPNSSTNTVWMNAMIPNHHPQTGPRQISMQGIKLPPVYGQPGQPVYVQSMRQPHPDPALTQHRPDSSRNPQNRYQ